MLFGKELIDTFFPYKKYREGQKEAIEAICDAFSNNKKFFILEAPTGSGKSAIAITIARMMQHHGLSSFYITSTKQLQHQINNEFKEVIDLKGRNAYKCTYWETLVESQLSDPSIKKLNIINTSMANRKISDTAYDEHLTCDRGPCKLERKPTCKICVDESIGLIKCPYWARLRQAQAASTTLFNFKSFIFNRLTGRFDRRQLMIIDEAHNIEEQLLDIIQIVIDNHLLKPKGIKIPHLDSIEAYKDYFDKINLPAKLGQIAYDALANNDGKLIDEVENLLAKYAIFMQLDSADWIFEYEGGHNAKLTLRPLHINEFAGKYLFDYADYVLLMSATILSPSIYCNSIGIKKDTCTAYRMGNKFPQVNRPIYYTPAGSMCYKAKQATLPLLLNSLEEICSEYQGKRGIIHTHSFDITEYIMNNCSQKLRDRLRYQKHYRTKEDMIEDHAKRPDSIIIAPAMHEGVDLKDDLSRFTILCKVPYPSLGDERMKIRMQESEEYYSWLTSTKLIQSVGRSIRSETDYADTYILDSDFVKFCKTAKNLLPGWFTETIHW